MAMPPIDPRDPVNTRSPSSGACFLYLAPSAFEDHLKLGFSRDPLARMQALHPRWFELFDLDRALLVETETVRDARKLELQFRRSLIAYNAPAPLTVRPQAGGHTEWYRGAYDALAAGIRELETAGYTVHDPARPWYRNAMRVRSDLLYSWLDALLSPDELDRLVRATPGQTIARDTLDAYRALDIDLQPLLPEAVLRWYRAAAGG